MTDLTSITDVWQDKDVCTVKLLSQHVKRAFKSSQPYLADRILAAHTLAGHILADHTLVDHTLVGRTAVGWRAYLNRRP